MQKLIVILFIHLFLLSALYGGSKISQDLMKEINMALESPRYIDAVIQLKKSVTISENDAKIYNLNAFNASSGFSSSHISGYENEQSNESIVGMIEEKSKEEVLFSDGPDINGKVYLKAIPSFLFELEKSGKVVSLDIAGRESRLQSGIQSPAEIPFHFQPLEWETDMYQGSGSPAGSANLRYSGTVQVKQVPWIRLHFSEANLGNASYIEITSLQDGASQRLNQTHLNQWQYTSAFFNGEGVTVKLYVAPEDKDIYIRMEQIMVGEFGPGAFTESICGPTDDRIPSNDPAAGRIVPIGCTGWNIVSGIQVTAGHCLGASAQTLEFNVPLSLSSGTIQHPGPEDQYAIDAASQLGTNGGIGNDWGIFTVFNNSVTGLQPMVAQGAAFVVAQDYLPDSIRITGYGVDDGTANQTEQTHVGPNAGSSGTTMRYRTDTTGGNSGSPVIDALTGKAVGVHTHGGCNSSGGNNSGTSTFHTDFWAEVSAAAIVADSLDPNEPTNFVAYSDYLTPTSMALSWDDPTNYFNGDTLLPAAFTIEIERDSVSIASVAGGTENYSDMGLNDGQFYDYIIFAKVTATDSTSEDVSASWHAGGSPIPAAPANLVAVADTVEAILSWNDPTTQADGTPLDDLDSLLVYRNGAVITALVPGVETYTDMPAPGFTYNYTVVAKDDEMPPNLSAPSNTAGAFVGTTPNFLVWVGPTVAALSAVSGDSIFAALVANGESAFLTNNLFEFGNDLSVFEGIFVVLGIYSNNHVIGSGDAEGPALEAYLTNGGRIYLEGGDCFNYDPETGGYQIRPWFGLDDGPDGGTDLAGVIGLNDLSAFSFAYNGENSFMDELQPLTSVPVWQNNANADLSGVFNIFGAGRAIGVVPSFGGFISSAEALNSSPRIVKTAEPNDAYIEETFKARPISNNQPEFVKKAAWYPELKKSQAELDDILQWTPGGPWIDANNQNDLMAAYVGLFRLQPTPPEIGLSDTVYVDTLLIGGMLDNMLTVSNIGGSFADSLFFTITENPAVGWLSVAPAADTLLANQAVDLTLSLDATGLAAGNYNTTLDVASNDPNHPLRTVSVTLNANDAPTISISPDTFDVTLSAGQTATDTLTISNLGAGPLDWEISAGGVRPELMWYKFDEVGASQTQNYAATGTPVPLTAALMGAISMGGSGQTGAALIGTGGSSGTDYVDTGWITNLGIDSWTIQLWLNNVDNSTTLFYHFGDNTATSFRCFSGGVAGAGNLLLRGPIADVLVTGVAPGPAVVDFVYDATVPEVRAYLNGVLNNTVAQSGVTVVGTAPFKVGGYSTSAGMAAGELMDDFKLFNRALDPGTESSRQEWLTFDTTSGILLPGESYDVTLTFDPTGLVGGEYSQQVVVTSNDPVNPEVSAGAHLVVVGQAAVGHSPAVVTMDTIFTGATDSKSLFVKNTGSDTLRVTGITSTNPLFTVDTTVFNVAPPLDSVEVTVTFSPLVVGTETGYLLVASNDPVTPVDSVDVIGVAVEAPVAVINAQFSNPVQVNSDDSVDVFINMSNSGGSALLWSASLSNAPGTMAAYGRPLFGPVEGSGYADLNPDLQSPPAGMYLDAMWDLQFSYNLEVVTGALGNAGGEFDGMYYYSTRWASNLLHKVDMAGNLVEEFSIAGVTGLRDLAFDGTFMYGGAAANTVYIMDFASKTLIGTIPSPVGVRNISYDEANNGLWLGNWADPPTLIDMSGTTLATLTTGLAGQYGAAYDGYSAGGPYLWVFDQGAGAGTPQIIHQFDLNTLSATGLTYDVTLDFPGTAGIAGGLWVGDGVVAGTASIGGVLQGTPDNFFVYELAVTAAPWIKLLANGGSIATGDQFDLPVRVYGVPSDEDTAYVIILTNDPSLPMADIMVTRDLITGIGDQATLPTTYDIAQNYPNPFNPTTTIKYQLPQVSDVKLVIYNVLGQKVRTLVNNRMEAGYHSLVWDGLNQQGSTVASGVYIYHFEAGDFQKTMKLMLLK